MNVFFLLLIGAASGFTHSVYSAISKSLLKSRTIEPFVLMLYVGILQAIISPAIWLFMKPVLPPHEFWAPLLMACLTCVVGYFFFYVSLYCGDVSSVMPLMGGKVIFSGILAIPMLNESHRWPIYLALALVAVSAGMLGYSPSATHDKKFPLKPIALILACCVIFAFTDIYVKRGLAFIDSYNYMVYYNIFVGIFSLSVVPYLKRTKAPVRLKQKDMWLILAASAFLASAVLLYAIMFKIVEGVVIPNILISTRGVFIVIISAVLTHRGSTSLEAQSRNVYLLRFVASILIMVSIWITLSN